MKQIYTETASSILYIIHESSQKHHSNGTVCPLLDDVPFCDMKAYIGKPAIVFLRSKVANFPFWRVVERANIYVGSICIEIDIVIGIGSTVIGIGGIITDIDIDIVSTLLVLILVLYRERGWGEFGRKTDTATDAPERAIISLAPRQMRKTSNLAASVLDASTYISLFFLRAEGLQ